jgi:hypothetical protein
VRETEEPHESAWKQLCLQNICVFWLATTEMTGELVRGGLWPREIAEIALGRIQRIMEILFLPSVFLSIDMHAKNQSGNDPRLQRSSLNAR